MTEVGRTPDYFANGYHDMNAHNLVLALEQIGFEHSGIPLRWRRKTISDRMPYEYVDIAAIDIGEPRHKKYKVLAVRLIQSNKYNERYERMEFRPTSYRIDNRRKRISIYFEKGDPLSIDFKHKG